MSLGPWEPLTPPAVARKFDGVTAPWWIAGGYAIELFVGKPLRTHGDIDVLLQAVATEGTHVTITNCDQVPMALIVPFAWYRHTEERLARYDAAYWSSWSDDGTFDDDAYARKIAELDRPAPLDPTDDQTTDPDADGDAHERDRC